MTLELNRINHNGINNPMFGNFKHRFTFEELNQLYTLEGQTLCKKCHSEISKIQMRGNTNYVKHSGCLV